MKVCKSCNKELPLSNFTKSKMTKDGYENKCKECRNKARLKHECTCETCGTVWKAQKKDSKYCSPKCKPQSTSQKVKTSCSYCGNEIEVIPSKMEKFNYHYCSMNCKNKHYGDTHKGENSHRFSNVKVKCYTCGIEFNKTKSQVEKHGVHFCSKECNHEGFKELLTGEHNPNYNPNKSEKDRIEHRNIPGYNEWVRNVFDRDNYTCQCCGDNKGGNLNAHHILNYSEYKHLRTDVNNGITLCDKCHVAFHNVYGYRKNNNYQLEEFLNKYENTEITA